MSRGNKEFRGSKSLCPGDIRISGVQNPYRMSQGHADFGVFQILTSEGQGCRGGGEFLMSQGVRQVFCFFGGRSKSLCPWDITIPPKCSCPWDVRENMNPGGRNRFFLGLIPIEYKHPVRPESCEPGGRNPCLYRSYIQWT